MHEARLGDMPSQASNILSCHWASCGAVEGGVSTPAIHCKGIQTLHCRRERSWTDLGLRARASESPSVEEVGVGTLTVGSAHG